MKKVLSLVLALALVLGCASFATAEDAKIKLIVWSFTAELQGMIEKYYAPNHPEIEFEFQVYPTDGNAYTTKVDNTFGANAASDEAPDIFTLEAAFVKHYVESDWTGDLKSIGFTDDELSVAFPVMAQIGQSAAGVQKGLSWQSTPGVLMYRASLAEKYRGVTSPEEMQEKVADWDAFLETAEELKEKSEGACKMVTGSGDIWNAYQYQRAGGWVVDGKLNIDPAREEYIEIAKKLIDGEYTNDTSSWGEAWYSDMIDAGEAKVFGWFGPAWLINYVLASKCQEDKINVGDYAVCVPPVGFWWGGSWLLASKLAVADADKKEFVSKFIEWVTLDTTKEGLQYGWANNTIEGLTAAKDTVSSGVVMKASDGSMEFLGGQNPFQIFVDATSYASSKCKSLYDADLNGTWQDLCNSYAHGKITKDELHAKFNDAAEAIDIEVG